MKIKLNKDENFAKLDPEQKQAIVKSAQDAAKSRNDALKSANNEAKVEAEELGKAIGATFSAEITAGKSVADTVQLIATKFKVTAQEARNMGFAEEFKKASAAGKLTEQQIEALRVKYGATKDKAA